MVRRATQRQLTELTIELERNGISLTELTSCCDEVILFGSRAIGAESADSDWDLLLVDCSQVFTAKGFDFIQKSSDESEAVWWRQSELAHHVAKYGVWIKGHGSWIAALDEQTDAAKRKRKKVSVKLESLFELWPMLRPAYRAKWLVRIRRDIQRLLKLIANVAVPPTPILDEEFSTTPNLVLTASNNLTELGDSELAGLIERFNELLEADNSGEQVSGSCRP